MNKFMKQHPSITLELFTEQATIALGKYLGELIKSSIVIYLHGDLGAGKTTIVRGFLHGHNYFDKVKSPTYSFVESYSQLKLPIHHFDLYRVKHPIELETIGIRDFLQEKGIILIEWPEKGNNFIPNANLKLKIAIFDNMRKINIIAGDPLGINILEKLDHNHLAKILHTCN